MQIWLSMADYVFNLGIVAIAIIRDEIFLNKNDLHATGTTKTWLTKVCQNHFKVKDYWPDVC